MFRSIWTRWRHPPDPDLRDRPDAERLRVGRRVVVLGAACTSAGLAAAAGIMVHVAGHERRTLETQALVLARSIAFAAEREVSTTFARLEALSTAPSLRAGDLAAFLAQLQQMPAPPGLWFVVADDTGHVLNSLLPLGDPRLPRNTGAEAPGMRTARVILEHNRPHVGGALWGPVARIYTIALGLPVTLGPDGRRGALMASVPQPRMLALLREQPLPPHWRAILVDQFSNVVARVEPSAVLGGSEPPTAWSRRLEPTAEHDLFTAEDFAGTPVLVALARSETLGWTAVVEVPIQLLEAPLRAALRRVALSAAALLLLGLAAAWWLKRRIDRSVGELADAADAAGERQRLSEARFRHYWEHTPEGLFIVRVTPEDDFVFEGLNPAHERLTGLSNEHLAGRRPEECLPAEVAAAVRRQYERCVDLRMPLRYRETLDLPGGCRNWETSLAPMCDTRTGRVAVVFGTARDITDRVRAEEAVRLNEERLRLALGAAGAGTWDHDLATATRHWSPELCALIGVAPGSSGGQDPWGALLDKVHPADRPRIDLALRSAIAHERQFTVEFRLLRDGPDSEPRWLAARGRVIRQPGASAPTEAGEPAPWRRLVGVVVDVTERRRAELAAQDSLALLQSSLDALSSQIVIIEAAGRIVAVNAAWRRSAETRGTLANAGPEANYLAACDAARSASADAGHVADGIRAVARGEMEEFRHEYRSDASGGGEDRWWQLRVTRFGTGPGLRVVIAHEDITEVRRSAEALSAAAVRMLTLQDEERRRIARELHDTTLQDLAGAIIGLDSVCLSREAEQRREALLEPRALLEKAVHEVRTLSYLLHPPLLDDCGLSDALDAYAEGFARRGGLGLALDLDEVQAGAIPPAFGVALFRVAQEAFANIRRHSGACSMRVRLRLVPGTAIELQVEDDGRGFARACPGDGSEDGPQDLRSLGVGIPGMRARLGQLGGTLRIETGPQGTRVIASLPLHAAASRDPPLQVAEDRQETVLTERAAG